MAVAPLNPLPEIATPDVLDLRHFSARQLRPLLEEEATVWQRRLRWDYRSSVELLLEYLDSRVLPGFAALAGGRVCGYTFCVYEGAKAVVGDAWTAGPTHLALPITHMLLVHLLELLEHTPSVERIESQLLLYDSGQASQPFADAGFHIHPRLFMEADPANPLLSTPPGEPDLPSGFTLSSWSPEFYHPAGELVHAAYRNHLDAEINDQYRTLHGSIRFLHNIVRFPGCGIFDPESSLVLRDRRGVLQGMVLCSRIQGAVGHITQLCIAPHLRGQGLGHLLMRRCAAILARRGFTAISLTVTQANTAAVAVYDQLGFTTSHRFDAMVWQRRP